jgi:hypothetical protein
MSAQVAQICFDDPMATISFDFVADRKLAEAQPRIDRPRRSPDVAAKPAPRGRRSAASSSRRLHTHFERPNNAMSVQVSPPPRTVHGAIIRSS